VVKGGPAEKAGIRKGDVLTAYGGKDIADSVALRNAVAATPVGQDMKAAILRDGKKMELTIRIENLEMMAKALAADIKERLGVEVRAVSLAEGKKYNLDDRQGVVITALQTPGTLGDAGFEVGDIILGINNLPITDLDTFVQLASALKPNSKVIILALDHRTGNMGNVEVTVK